MIRVMLFIDGTWLYANTPRLADAFGDPDFHVDFGKLPRVLADEVSRQLGDAEIDVRAGHRWITHGFLLWRNWLEAWVPSIVAEGMAAHPSWYR